MVKFELHFRFESERRNMSERSKQLAKEFAHNKDQQAISDELRLHDNKILDKGFIRMRTDLTRELERQCEELNHEPEIGNILAFSLSDEEGKITRKDTGSTLAVEWDSVRHAVTLNCDKPAKFRYTVEVKPTTNGQGFWYANRKGVAIPHVSVVADEALCALLGIRR